MDAQKTYLADWREAMGLGVGEAAAALGMSLTTYSEYEYGRRRGTNTQKRIPKWLGLACSALAYDLPVYPDLDKRPLQKKLRGRYDYGSTVTIGTGETFAAEFDAGARPHKKLRR